MTAHSGNVDNFLTGRIITALFAVFVFLLAFTPIKDPDALMHLSLGRLIWELKGIPDTEMFVYPNEGKDFQYTSSLFAAVSFISYKLFDGLGPVLIKALAAALAFFLMFRDALRPHRNWIITIAILLMSVSIAEYRFVLRPDVAMMVFLTFSIFSLNAFLYENRKYIYALPLVFLVWGNTHSSVNLIFVLFPAFIAGGLIQTLLNRKLAIGHPAPTGNQLKKASLVFALSLIAALANPNFVWQFMLGGNVLSSEWSSLVVELLPPVGRQKSLLIGIISVIAVSFVLNWRRFSVFHFLIALPFLYMPFMANRFIFLSVIVGGPIAARNFSAFISGKSIVKSRRAIPALSLTILLAYSALALSNIEPFGRSTRKFGGSIKENESLNRLISFMDRYSIEGRVLNPFHLGQYIIWKSYPKRTVFIDGRLDKYSETLIRKSNDFIQSNMLLDEIYADYRFDSIVLEHPNPVYIKAPGSGHGHSAGGGAAIRYEHIEHPLWALVYWDDEYMLYVRREPERAQVIMENEYRHAFPDREIGLLYRNLMRKEQRPTIMRELRRNIKMTGSKTAYAMLGLLLFENGDYQGALDAFSNVSHKRAFHVKTAIMFNLNWISRMKAGDAYWILGNDKSALTSYVDAINIKEDAETLMKAGKIQADTGDAAEAVKYLSRSIELDPRLAEAYPALIALFRKSGDKARANELTIEYKNLVPDSESRTHFIKGVELYRKKEYRAAITEFNSALISDPDNAGILTNLGYAHYDSGDLQAAAESFRKALSSDSNNANAHYGLGLSGVRSGDNALVKKYFSEYLKLVPSGKFADKAKEYLEQID